MRHAISQISLIHGWFPVVAQLISALALLVAIGWRSRRWRTRYLPGLLVLGIACAVAGYRYVTGLGIAGDPAPVLLWVWITALGAGAGLVVAGWPSARWWRRLLSVLTVPLCTLCVGLAVNSWVGYLPTVHAAWSRATSAPVPGQVDRGTVLSMQLSGIRPEKGVVTPVSIPNDKSGFRHRTELVYLPPAWFDQDPAPRLPTVLMIGSALNTPADWVWAGMAVETANQFAAEHSGYAPVLVFTDATGAFNNDTECVNGTRGNAADHLVKEVVPYMVSEFRVAPGRKSWGIAGWSMGGTCALDLTVMHPSVFSTFVDIAGDASPNTGSKAQTISTLFGGDESAWARFDPQTAMDRHGPYKATAGWFDVPGDGSAHPTVTAAGIGAVTNGPHDKLANPEGQDFAANSMCTLASSHGIRCAVTDQPGKHDWPFAAQAFAASLPWLAGRLGTPTVPRIPLPGLTPEHNGSVQAAASTEAR